MLVDWKLTYAGADLEDDANIFASTLLVPPRFLPAAEWASGIFSIDRPLRAEDVIYNALQRLFKGRRERFAKMSLEELPRRLLPRRRGEGISRPLTTIRSTRECSAPAWHARTASMKRAQWAVAEGMAEVVQIHNRELRAVVRRGRRRGRGGAPHLVAAAPARARGRSDRASERGCRRGAAGGGAQGRSAAARLGRHQPLPLRPAPSRVLQPRGGAGQRLALPRRPAPAAGNRRRVAGGVAGLRHDAVPVRELGSTIGWRRCDMARERTVHDHPRILPRAARPPLATARVSVHPSRSSSSTTWSSTSWPRRTPSRPPIRPSSRTPSCRSRSPDCHCTSASARRPRTS